MTARTRLGRWLVTLPTLVYGVLPPFFDYSHTHVLHPAWPPHARLHMVWLMTTNCSIAAVVVWLLWFDSRRHHWRLAGVLTLCVLGGFWVATALMPLYGGALSDVGGVPKVLGIDRNALLFSVIFLMAAAGTALIPRTSSVPEN